MDLVSNVNKLNLETVDIFPNPATNIINIEVENVLELEVTIYDLTGKLILKTVNQSRINISSLAQGVYLLKITDLGSKRQLTERIIKSQY